MAVSTWFCFAILLLSFADVTCDTDDIDRLYNNVTKYYIKDIRPAKNHKEMTEIHFNFKITSIKEFVEKESRFSVIGVFNFTWKDHRITWDPDRYGGITELIIRQEQIWVPRMIFGNTNNDLKPLGRDWLKVRYQSDGTATWTPANVYDFTCAADMTHYPFDSHECQIFMFPEGYRDYEVKIMSTPEVDTMLYTPHPLWTLEGTGTTVSYDFNIQFIDMYFTIRRVPSFYIVSLILPVCLIEFLGTLVFLLPANSGERMGFAVTVLLTMSLFLTIVSDSHPNISRLCYSLLADLVIGTLITVCTVFGLRFHYREVDEEIPGYLQKIVLSCCKRKDQIYNKSKYCSTVGATSTNMDRDRELNTAEVKVPEQLSVIKISDKQTDNLNVGWNDVTRCLDLIFFLLFFTLVIAKNMSMFFLFFN